MQFQNIVMALLWPVVTVYAQPARQLPLSIGDQVPDIKFEQMINYPTSTAKLSDFKGKLVILDFWGTWCTSCLHGFPNLDSLQLVFRDQMQVILVNGKATGDDSLKVSNFFRKWATRTGKALELPSVVNDTEAWDLFQPKLVPHYAWISPEGKLIAITSSTPVVAANIQSILNGEPVSFAMKKDQDTERPLFSSIDIPGNGLLQYSVFVKGGYDGLPSGNHRRITDNVIHGWALTNSSILSLYKSVMYGIDKDMHDRKIILEVKDSSKLLPPENTEEQAAWNRDNLYSLDLIVPVDKAGQLYMIMLEELNRYSGYYGRLEKRKVKCWVLKKIGGNKQPEINKGEMDNRLWDDDRPYLKNGTAKDIVTSFNHLDILKLLVLDETRYGEKIDLFFDAALTDLAVIQRGLRQSGLKLVKTERIVEVFVIREKAP